MKNLKQKQFTGVHRILHWTIGLSMLVLFFTGFLRMYWMNKKTVINAIETKLSAQAISVDEKILRAIAKDILEPMWEWHELAAYIVFFVVTARFLYMLVKGIKFPNPFAKQPLFKERLQGMIYILFYLFVFVTALTGAYLKWGGGDWKEPLEMIHKWAIYWFPIFIVIHILGIVIAELTDKKGIVSKMISGNQS